MPTSHNARPAHTNRRAFTLLELMVVFVIIAILVGVALMVGHKVVGGSKIKSTQNVLQSLDQAMEAYIQAKGGSAARFPDRFVDVAKNEFPLADASTAGAGGAPLPSGELTVELLLNEPRSAAILKGIPSEFLERVDSATIGNIGNAIPQRATSSGNQNVTYTRVKDAWGRPIRFVHPAFQGIYGTGASPVRSFNLSQNNGSVALQLTRDWNRVIANGDTTFQGVGDGGRCEGGRPYFYSTGPDAKAATVEDNVYSNRPQFDAAVKAAGQ
ncbi:MAG: type II secretion system protein [Phycisphaerales bacterium]